MSLALVCWDFGDTLADERWMLQAPEGCPEWPDAWGQLLANNPELIERWDLGEASFDDVVPLMIAELEDLGAEPQSDAWVRDHCRWCCEHLSFFPAAVEALIAWRGVVAQACVTVNPDVFRDWVVPAYDLTSRFDMVVTSDTVHSVNKVHMAQRALNVLGLDAEIADCLLIDNRMDNCREFRAAGGQTYHFRSDAEFGPDRARGRFPAPLTR